ncbi:DUF1579 domain-containing protein [Ferruginibacter sp.]
MKRTILTICTATVVLLACNNSTDEKKPAGGDSSAMDKKEKMADTKKDEPWVVVDSATMMKAMMDYATPGDMHKWLAASNGTWKGDMTMWDYDGAAPQKTTGTAVNTMILGGRYQSSKHTSTMMGMPFEGESITGYDNAKKKFVSSWIDNWGTGIMMMEGDWDAAKKTLNMSGTYPDVCRPGKQCTMREVFTVIDDKTQKMEMYGPDQKTGKEFKMMEIMMTKK